MVAGERMVRKGLTMLEHRMSKRVHEVMRGGMEISEDLVGLPTTKEFDFRDVLSGLHQGSCAACSKGPR